LVIVQDEGSQLRSEQVVYGEDITSTTPKRENLNGTSIGKE